MKDKIPVVTIIIPTYNQAGFICDAIESALAQSYRSLQIIVGDDASSDETQEIVRKYKDARLNYVRNKQNIGRTGNYKNLLFNHATGDFIVNLDGDDYFTDIDYIAEAVKLIGTNKNVVMVVAKVTTKSPHNEYISTIPSVKNATGLQILKKLPDSNYWFMHMGVLYARKPAIEIDFYRSSALSSDWESLYRLALHGEVKYLDRNIGVWRIHGKNETGTADIEKLLGNLAIWNAIYMDALNFGMSQTLAKMASARCVAFFAQSSCANISKAGNKGLMKFVVAVFQRYKLAVLIIALTPKYAARVAVSFFGYYRRKSPV